MEPLTLVTVSRNYFNMPAWVARHAGLFAAEGLEVSIDHIEGIEEVDARVRDGRAQLAYGVTEHVVLDAESGGGQIVIGGNVNKLPFSLVARPEVRRLADLRGRPHRRLVPPRRLLLAGHEAARGARPALPGGLRAGALRPDPRAVGRAPERRDRRRAAGRPARLHRARPGLQLAREPARRGAGLPVHQPRRRHRVGGGEPRHAAALPPRLPARARLVLREPGGRQRDRRAGKRRSRSATPTGHGGTTRRPRSSRATARRASRGGHADRDQRADPGPRPPRRDPARGLHRPALPAGRPRAWWRRERRDPGAVDHRPSTTATGSGSASSCPRATPWPSPRSRRCCRPGWSRT